MRNSRLYIILRKMDRGHLRSLLRHLHLERGGVQNLLKHLRTNMFRDHYSQEWTEHTGRVLIGLLPMMTHLAFQHLH